MQLTGKEDLRVIKTIEVIKSSFEALICEKDYEKITVKELPLDEIIDICNQLVLSGTKGFFENN